MDALLASTDIEEACSIAYAQAVAASAGYAISKKDFDRDGVDITIEAGGSFRPKIDVQLKATTSLEQRGDNYSYKLRQRNYDLLRIDTQVPRILVVLRLPAEKEKWLTVAPTALIMRHCAHWVCLRGFPENTNTTSTTIDIPVKNRFNSEGLQKLMENSRSGKLR